MTTDTAFPPTLREVMLRPWWIGMLVFALVIAAIFAWLGQWQLGRAIDTSAPVAGAPEQVRPIAEVTEPGAYLPEPLVGQRVEVSGSFVAGDFLVVSSRFNDGQQGYWVTGQLRTDAATPTSLAVAVGWTGDRAVADAAASDLNAAPARSGMPTVPAASASPASASTPNGLSPGPFANECAMTTCRHFARSGMPPPVKSVPSDSMASRSAR